MAFSHNVKLPIDVTPQWPSYCVRCSIPNPDSVFKFRASRVGWDQLLTLSWAIGKRPIVEAPACSECRTRLKRERLIRNLISWPVTVAVAALVGYILHRLGFFPKGPYRRWIFVAYACGALLPFIIWEVLHPLTLDATCQGDTITFEFRDRRTAAMFCIMNDAKEIT